MKDSHSVQVRVEIAELPTYMPAAPDKNPMFLEKRVYQGSSGRVYPLPFTDRIAETPVNRKWTALWIENEFLRAMILPELGGRIHVLQDKTNGYDLIYNQPVIKPALVGLAGPWASGGIEFNWPQHHRPATFLPVDYEIEEHPGGSKTIWCSDHDPMARMKGMHGACLHPGRACLELKVRACNRTPFTQTFLWWANVATRVHEAYQSFFPPDVCCVADHARRSMTEYPLARGFYYGVDYARRAREGVPAEEAPRQFTPPAVPKYAPNDLSFYANIPVPCSYMALGSERDFFGGYDYKARAGLVHVASHHISPGKKQWTWGNHEFGYAWDRHLTDPGAGGQCAPYIEIMAGVYTDNQPDFSFLQPGETKTWSQYWYPIQKIGRPCHANLEAAVSLDDKSIGICVTRERLGAAIILTAGAKTIFSVKHDLTPGAPFVHNVHQVHNSRLRLLDNTGAELLSFHSEARPKAPLPAPADEPSAPESIPSADELFLTGLHLEQYRHATRCPTLYWREALRRDPLDARCNNAMGLWHLKRGEFQDAETHFRRAIERLTRRNANPSDGEPFYNLGLCLRFLGKTDAACAAFYKACWNQAWQSCGFHALAEMDCAAARWPAALDHLDRSLRMNSENLRALDLKALVLRKLNREADADALLRQTVALDRLDWWARHLLGGPVRCDWQARLDIAHDCARAGFFAEAIALLNTPAPPGRDLPDQNWGALPLVQFTLGWLHEKNGDSRQALRCFRQAAALPPDYCFPARLEEIAILEAAMRAHPRDARAPYYLGNLLYDRRRHEEAIKLWEKSARLDPNFPIIWRNLGIGYFNVRKNGRKARAAYDKAFRRAPDDARLLFERDQLWRRLGEQPERRLAELQKHPRLVERRDDLTVELCALLNQTGRPAEARALLSARNFQPWEGGEGGALGQYTRALAALGRSAMAGGDFAAARAHFDAALVAPPNLGEARHLLVNQSDIHFGLGCALAGLRDRAAARGHWRAAAGFKGDFQAMSVRAFSEMTYYSARSLERLGRRAEACRLFRRLLDDALKLEKAKAKIDFFATSLPTMLVFDDDLQARQKTTALFLQAQARLGLGQTARAQALLRTVLRRDPNHAAAADLLAESAA
ncbi:MAG TPA: DUF5107 domain-containing protein [Verrucomicrobiae bacterium]|jgi:tetratricopeptide (TPR) repeat protein